MNKRNLFLSKTALTVLGIGLLVYAASRTLNFVQDTMPAEQKFLGYLFLLATGIGALIWLAVFLNVAEGAKQRGLSFAMGLIDLLAEFALVYADTMMESSERGLVAFSQDETRIFVLASIGVIGLNILGWYLFKLWDPHAERESAARDLVDDVSAAAFKELNRPDNKAAMIAELAPTLRASILSEVTEMVMGMASQHTKSNARAYSATAPALPDAPAQAVPNQKANPLPGRADFELAASIMPGIAAYRACRKCGDIVPLTQTHCFVCGQEMTPVKKWTEEGAKSEDKNFPA